MADGLLPVPDPTVLTTAALVREVEALKELIELRFDAQSTLIQAKLDALDRLYDSKIGSIQQQAEQRAKDSSLAIDAALKAAKEAVGAQNESNTKAIAKSEGSVDKQLDAIGVIVKTATASIDSRLTELKDRITAMENRSIGAGGQRQDTQQGWSFLFGVIGSIVAVGALIFTAVSRLP